jgi:hypothetical protein
LILGGQFVQKRRKAGGIFGTKKRVKKPKKAPCQAARRSA